MKRVLAFFDFCIAGGKQRLPRVCFIINRLQNGREPAGSRKSFNFLKCNTMTRTRTNKINRTSVWVAILAIFLIILLVIWLTFADLTGNTDVAAFLAPYIVNSPV